MLSLIAIYTDDFFVVFKNLVWCETTFALNNFRNFSSILVLKNELSWPWTNLSSSDLLDLGSDFNFLQIVCILVFAQENWRMAPIRHYYLNATEIVASFLPVESHSLNWFVFGHSLQISNTRVSEINWLVSFAEKWEFSECFKTFFTISFCQWRWENILILNLIEAF